MASILHAVIMIGAAARLTRLTTRDTITQPIRDALLYNHPQRTALSRGEPLPAPTRPRLARIRLWLHQLATCDWCAGLWISLLVAILAATIGPHPVLLTLGTALALSQAVGVIAARE